MLKREEGKEGHKGEHKEVGGRERRKREGREEEEKREGREGREGERGRKRDKEAKNPSQHVVGTYAAEDTVFLRSDAAATIFSAARFCAATIQGRRLFLREPADINDGWIRYVHIVHCTYK